MQVLAETGEYLSRILVESGAHEHLFHLLEQEPISTTLQELASECLFVLTSMPNLKSNMLLFACKKGLAKVRGNLTSRNKIFFHYHPTIFNLLYECLPALVPQHQLVADLHCRIRIPIPIPLQTANEMATFYYAQVFVLHRDGFKFQLPRTGIGSESESRSLSVNKPLHCS